MAIEVGLERERAEDLMRMKLKFAFGHIRKTDELIDSLAVGSEPVAIRNGASVRRMSFNTYEFSCGDETATIDLKLAPEEVYATTYVLGYRRGFWTGLPGRRERHCEVVTKGRASRLFL